MTGDAPGRASTGDCAGRPDAMARETLQDGCGISARVKARIRVRIRARVGVRFLCSNDRECGGGSWGMVEGATATTRGSWPKVTGMLGLGREGRCPLGYH